ncbi:MAG TPA: hypothetical protein VEK84_11220 [Terriglobales bacterium]|nr:hypothetical protein [Terriglobales bacterium]
MDLKEQGRQQDLERNSADARDRALKLVDQQQRNNDERARKEALDAHEREVRTAEDDRKSFDARLAAQAEVSEWQIHREQEEGRMQMEADLRKRAIAGHSLDEQFVEHETQMLNLETERARAERERADVQRRADQAIEKTDIELLRERMAAEHSWELERIDRQSQVISKAVEKVSAAPQPLERMSVVQFQSGNGSPIPNSPAYQISQAALIIRELFKLFTDQK